MADERRASPPGKQARHTLGFAAFSMVLVCFAVIVLKSDLNPDAKALVTLIIGRFLGYIDAIYNFEFGQTRAAGPTAAPPPPSTDAAPKEVVR